MGKAYQLAARAALLAVLLCSAGGAAAESDDGWSRAQPAPGLSPTEVVRLQLEALRNNDAGDRGIAVAFRFASPDNRAQTGPLPRFAHMIRNGPYALMLRYRSASYDEARVQGREALQRVTLVADGESATYLFLLTRQQEGECVDCWMTDSVFLEPPAEDRAQAGAGLEMRRVAALLRSRVYFATASGRSRYGSANTGPGI